MGTRLSLRSGLVQLQFGEDNGGGTFSCSFLIPILEAKAPGTGGPDFLGLPQEGRVMGEPDQELREQRIQCLPLGKTPNRKHRHHPYPHPCLHHPTPDPNPAIAFLTSGLTFLDFSVHYRNGLWVHLMHPHSQANNNLRHIVSSRGLGM